MNDINFLGILFLLLIDGIFYILFDLIKAYKYKKHIKSNIKKLDKI